ncbi:Eukaryotic translation initiation factor 2C_ 2, partial [Caligus rogercresseyi]
GCLNSVFTEDERRLLTNEISGLKIKTTHGNTPRLFRAVNMGRLLPQHTFFECKVTGQRVSVASFFKSKYGLSLEYPMRPDFILALELCWLVRGQRVMKKLTEQQATSMIKLMASSAPNRQRDVQGFWIRKESEMMKARGHVLRPPMIEYNERNGGGPVDVLVNRGSWDAHQKEFKEPKGIFI